MDDEYRMLWAQLTISFGDVEILRAWLAKNFPWGLAKLKGGNLDSELLNLYLACQADGNMNDLLQELTDHLDSKSVPGLVFAITRGAIQPRRNGATGQPGVPSYLRWFIANRPFVNRVKLRTHVQQLPNSQGAEAVLVIEGARRTGKTMSASLALGEPPERNSRLFVSIDDYDLRSVEVNARRLAVSIVGDEQGCPVFDITKEYDAVNGLVDWIVGRFTVPPGPNAGPAPPERWIIIDGCDRKVMTRAARDLLSTLVKRFWIGALPGVRLVMADFALATLPVEMRDYVRYDRAELPGEPEVEDWCRQLAGQSGKTFAPELPARWAHEVFDGLDGFDRESGAWHIALDQRLRRAASVIRSLP